MMHAMSKWFLKFCISYQTISHELYCQWMVQKHLMLSKGSTLQNYESKRLCYKVMDSFGFEPIIQNIVQSSHMITLLDVLQAFLRMQLKCSVSSQRLSLMHSTLQFMLFPICTFFRKLVLFKIQHSLKFQISRLTQSLIAKNHHSSGWLSTCIELLSRDVIIQFDFLEFL